MTVLALVSTAGASCVHVCGRCGAWLHLQVLAAASQVVAPGAANALRLAAVNGGATHTAMRIFNTMHAAQVQRSNVMHTYLLPMPQSPTVRICYGTSTQPVSADFAKMIEQD